MGVKLGNAIADEEEEDIVEPLPQPGISGARPGVSLGEPIVEEEQARRTPLEDRNLETIIRSAAEGLVTATGNLPTPAGGQRLKSLLETVQGKPFSGPETAAQMQAAPANILAGLQGAPTRPPLALQAETEALKQANPVAALTGDLLSTTGQVMGLRGPGLGRKAGGMFDELVERAVRTGGAALTKRAGKLGVTKQLDDIQKGEGWGRLMRGLGRTAETGFEGLWTGILNGSESPLTEAGWNAGLQAGSSGVLTLAKGSLELPFTIMNESAKNTLTGKLVGIGAQAFILSQMIKLGMNAVPGGSDNPLVAEEKAYEKVTAGLLAGLVFAFGKRTQPGGIGRNFPILADAMIATPRSAIINLVQAANNDPDFEADFYKIAANPSVFPPKLYHDLDKAIQDGRVEEFMAEIRKDPKIGAALAEDEPRLVGIKQREPVLPFGP